jgi:hypothetical protein
VVVGRGDVDAPGLDRLAVAGMGGRQRSAAAEDGRQGAGAVGRDVQDHEDGGVKVGWQRAGQDAERLNATGRGADDHDVVARHDSS